MQHTGSPLQQRVQQLRRNRAASIRNHVRSTATPSIETNAGKANIYEDYQPAGEVPPAVMELVDNKAFVNRYKRLIREGHLSALLRLVAIARTKDKPNRWFVKACSVAMWERTLEYLAKLDQVERVAAEVARQLGGAVTAMTYKAVWKLGHDAVRLAVRAKEQGRHRGRLFAWLVTHADAPGVLQRGSAA